MAASAHNYEHSAEYRAFKQYFADLLKAIQDPLTLSAELFSAGLLTRAKMRDIPSKIPSQQLTDLLLAVEGQIIQFPQNFYTFVEALEKDGPMLHLCDKLRDACAQLKTETPQAVSSSKRTAAQLKTETPQVVPPSHHANTTVASYAQFLKDCYRQPLPDDDKLLTTASKHFIELAVISRKGVTRREADEFTRKSLHGQMEEILRKKTPIALEDILKPEEGRAMRRVLVEGAPGVGKSTLAWEVCHKWEELETVKQYELVVLVRLREKRAQEARCLEELLPRHGSTNMEELLAAIARGNGMLVICDGFDELPDEQRREGSVYIELLICDGFDELPDEQRREGSVYIELLKGRLLPEATVIITSRPSVSADLWSHCQHNIDMHLEVMGFTREKINKYAESVFSGDILQGFLSYITSNPPIYGMMYIPLNAVIVALTYEHSYAAETPFPTTMTQLYDALICTLIRRHLVSAGQDPQQFRMPKSLQRVEDINKLPSQAAQQLYELARVAYEGLNENRYVFTDLGEDFGHLGMMKKTTSLDPSVGTECSYNFLHLTFQEYLSALHLALQLHNGLQMLPSLKQRDIVVRFLAGLCNHDDRHSYHLYPSLIQVLSSQCKGKLPLQVVRCAYECPSIMHDIQQVQHWLTSGVIGCKIVPPLPVFDYYVIGYYINHFSGRWRVMVCEQEQADLLVKGLQSSPVALGRIHKLRLGTLCTSDYFMPDPSKLLPPLLRFCYLHTLVFKTYSFSDGDATLLQQLISPGSTVKKVVLAVCLNVGLVLPAVLGPSSLESLKLQFLSSICFTEHLSQNTNLKELTIDHALVEPVAAALQNNTSLTHLTIGHKLQTTKTATQSHQPPPVQPHTAAVNISWDNILTISSVATGGGCS